MQDGSLLIHSLAIAEGRVHAVVVLGRNQLQRILASEGIVAEPGFHRWRVVEAFRAEFAFARGRAESTFRERQERRWQVQPYEMLALQTLQRDSLQKRMIGVQQ